MGCEKSPYFYELENGIGKITQYIDYRHAFLAIYGTYDNRQIFIKQLLNEQPTDSVSL